MNHSTHFFVFVSFVLWIVALVVIRTHYDLSTLFMFSGLVLFFWSMTLSAKKISK